MDRSIIFSTEMVRAILDGRKMQTRRVIIQINKCAQFTDETRHIVTAQELLNTNPSAAYAYRVFCPYGQPGDLLWVRESFALHPTAEELGHPVVFYRARGDEIAQENRWRPSIFMPRWASRLTLGITAVRVERLHEIGYADVLAEGIVKDVTDSSASVLRKYMTLWDHINTKRGFPWSSNPWVWVIEFIRRGESDDNE